MHLPLKSIEQAYGSNHRSDDFEISKNGMSKKSIGEILLRRAMENDTKIEDDVELMNKLKTLEQDYSLDKKYNPAIDKIVDYVNKFSKKGAKSA